MPIHSNAYIETTIGRKLVKDVEAGDFVYGADGSATEVISNEFVGEQSMYVFQKHKIERCAVTADAEMLVRYADDEKRIDAKQLFDEYSGTTFKVAPHGPIQYPSVRTPVEPYVLGYFSVAGNLADKKGVMIRRNLVDEDYAKKALTQVSIKLGADSIVANNKTVHNGRKTIEYKLLKNGRVFRWHSVKQYFPEYLNPNKKLYRIPPGFFYASVSQRLELLAGFLDGKPRKSSKIGGAGSFRIPIDFRDTNNAGLMEDYARLASGLGLSISYQMNGSSGARNRLKIHLTPEEAATIPSAYKEGLITAALIANLDKKKLGDLVEPLRILDKKLPANKLITESGSVIIENNFVIFEK